jgi:hypothetical protein
VYAEKNSLMPKYPYTYLIGTKQQQSKDTCTNKTSTHCTKKQQLPVCNNQQHLTENAVVVSHSPHIGIRLHVLSRFAMDDDGSIYGWFV